jgi:hypothetical protein
MPLKLKCPSCGKVYAVSDDHRGKKVQCKCGKAFRIPAADDAPVAPAASKPTAKSATPPAPSTPPPDFDIPELSPEIDRPKPTVATTISDSPAPATSRPAMQSPRQRAAADARQSKSPGVDEPDEPSSYLSSQEVDASKPHKKYVLAGGGVLVLIALGIAWLLFGFHSQPRANQTAAHQADSQPAGNNSAEQKTAATGQPTEPAPPVDPAKLVASMPHSDRIGGSGGEPYAVIDEQHLPVLGFRYRTGDWGGMPAMAVVQPLYTTDAGPNTEGEVVLAKPGYAVGGLTVNADDVVRGIQVLFMRVEGDKLNPADNYQSDWLGTPPTAASTTLTGIGKKVLGVFGSKSTTLDSIGLLFDK